MTRSRYLFDVLRERVSFKAEKASCRVERVSCKIDRVGSGCKIARSCVDDAD